MHMGTVVLPLSFPLPQWRCMVAPDWSPCMVIVRTTGATKAQAVINSHQQASQQASKPSIAYVIGGSPRSADWG